MTALLGFDFSAIILLLISLIVILRYFEINVVHKDIFTFKFDGNDEGKYKNQKRVLLSVGILLFVISFLSLIPSFDDGDNKPPSPNQEFKSSSKNSSKGNQPILAIGSGTVYRYFREYASKVFSDSSFTINILEGGSMIGAKLLYDKDREGSKTRLSNQDFFALSSKKLSVEDFTGDGGERFRAKNPYSKFLEIHIGNDYLKITAGVADEKQPKEKLKSNFKTVFSNLKGKKVDGETLVDFMEQDTTKILFDLYLTNKGSGTRKKYEEIFRGVKNDQWTFPSNWKFYDPSKATRDEIRKSGKPWMILGSDLYSLSDNLLKESYIYYENFQLKETHRTSYKRELYVYGMLSSEEYNSDGTYIVGGSKYLFINHLLKELQSNLEGENLKIIEEKIEKLNKLTNKEKPEYMLDGTSDSLIISI